MITVANPDLIPDAAQPPIIEISFHCPPSPALMVHHPALIPIRVLLLRLYQRHTALLHNPLEFLPLPIRCRYVLQKAIQLHLPTKPKRHYRIALAQLRPRTDYPESLQKSLHLWLFDRRGKSIPNLPGK